MGFLSYILGQARKERECVCLHAYVCACVHTCVCACLHTCACVVCVCMRVLVRKGENTLSVQAHTYHSHVHSPQMALSSLVLGCLKKEKIIQVRWGVVALACSECVCTRESTQTHPLSSPTTHTQVDTRNVKQEWLKTALEKGISLGESVYGEVRREVHSVKTDTL